MKILTVIDLYKEEMKGLGKEFKGTAEKDILDECFNSYIANAYADYKRYHVGHRVTWMQYRKTTDHGELCTWCNIHAAIRDLKRKKLECMHKAPGTFGNGCADCLKGSTWYKRLI